MSVMNFGMVFPPPKWPDSLPISKKKSGWDPLYRDMEKVLLTTLLKAY